MGELTVTLYIGISCDKPKCGNRYEYDSLGGDYVQDSMTDGAVDEGWTRWVGSRSAFWYCPEHQPGKPGRSENCYGPKHLRRAAMWRSHPHEDADPAVPNAEIS